MLFFHEYGEIQTIKGIQIGNVNRMQSRNTGTEKEHRDHQGESELRCKSDISPINQEAGTGALISRIPCPDGPDHQGEMDSECNPEGSDSIGTVKAIRRSDVVVTFALLLQSANYAQVFVPIFL